MKRRWAITVVIFTITLLVMCDSQKTSYDAALKRELTELNSIRNRYILLANPELAMRQNMTKEEMEIELKKIEERYRVIMRDSIDASLENQSRIEARLGRELELKHLNELIEKDMPNHR